MSEQHKAQIGSITWTDLTVANAQEIKDFYQEVIGWEPSPVSMGDYDDYNMNHPETGETQVGICHARGENADIPPCWLVYITVANVSESAKKCKEMGGKIIVSPKVLGEYGRFCVIEDPAGAVAALFEPKP